MMMDDQHIDRTDPSDITSPYVEAFGSVMAEIDEAPYPVTVEKKFNSNHDQEWTVRRITPNGGPISYTHYDLRKAWESVRL